MKYVIVVGDGMSDYPIKELGDRTPLEYAKTPNLDFVARNGKCGMLRTLYKNFPLDSGVANLSLLGYDPRKYYPGRGPLEAANMNVNLSKNDIAMRCNLITEENGVLKDYSAGHITNEEAEKLINFVNENLGRKEINFYPGVSYRHLLVLRNDYSVDLNCKPPHDIVGQEIQKNLIKPLSDDAESTALMLNKLTLKSVEILEQHEINKKRISEGKNPGNMIWPWGPGKFPRMPKFEAKYSVKGAMISAVNILRGIARCVGMEVVDVPGITGYLDTNYKGKADYAVKALEKNDLVFVHIESTDEAGHEGSIEHKIQAIQDVDLVVGRIMNALEGKEFKIAVMSDHPTPIPVKTHTADPVPFAIYTTNEKGDGVEKYSEREIEKKGAYGLREGYEFMELLVKNKGA